MCLGICILEKGQPRIVQFIDAQARLSIDGSPDNRLITWGRNIQEHGQLPLGGWIDSIQLEKGKWNRYFPKQVKIAAVKFMEQDMEGRLHWFDVTRGSFIQGVILRQGNETRIYIVTLTPETPNNPFQRWPVLVY